MFTIHQIQCPVGLQQCSNQRWRPVEGRIYHKSRIVRTDGHVLWVNKFSGHLPDNDEYHLCRRNGPRMAHNLLYMDDMAIHMGKKQGELDAQHRQQHRQLVNKVLSVLQSHNLFLKPEKCEFEKDHIDFLGIRI